MGCSVLKYVYTISIISFLIIACKKSIDTPADNYTTLKVLESKTNIPISDASVVLYKCVLPNPWGCLKDSIVGTALTDNGGSFQVYAKLNVYYIGVTHSDYWDGSSGGSFTALGDVYLTPKAHTKIHLKKTNIHSQELMLHLILSYDSAPIYFFGLESSYNLVSDSTVVMESFGNNDNYISWYFTDKAGTVVTTETGGNVPGYYINRFDTATVEINY